MWLFFVELCILCRVPQLSFDLIHKLSHRDSEGPADAYERHQTRFLFSPFQGRDELAIDLCLPTELLLREILPKPVTPQHFAERQLFRSLAVDSS